ncbi:hypothetical protein [Phenylobacterium sp.]|uniref:hypothetical protein n=1 Tax=Phenylobacterium sp. TaxID=1871053 RepID=UPI002C213EB3|nr:hypothetical protein [Phenylobacterium sp.]HLZ77112.1 hypothetical protein [Phenylobacterium sp.]
MPRLIRPSGLRAYARRLLLRAAAAGLAAVAGMFAGVAAGLALFGVVRLWLPPLWAAVATFAVLALGAASAALTLALLGRVPPPPPPTIWDWLLAGDLGGRPEGGLRAWALAGLRELVRRPLRRRG